MSHVTALANNIDPILVEQKKFKYMICSFFGGFVGSAFNSDNTYYEAIGFLVGGIAVSIFSSFFNMYQGISQDPIKALLVKSIYHHTFSTFTGIVIGLIATKEKRTFTLENSISFYIITYLSKLIYQYSKF